MKKDTIVKSGCLLAVVIIMNVLWATLKEQFPLKRMLVSFAVAFAVIFIIYILECKVKITLRELFNKGMLCKSKDDKDGSKKKELLIIDIFAFLVVIILSVYVRYEMFYFISADYTIFWDPWVDIFRSIGWQSFGCNIGDYPPLYTEILIALSMTNMSKLMISKLIPMIFDYVMGVVAVLLYGELKSDATIHHKILVFAAIVLNPIVLLNSAMWSQCDGIYTSFILMSTLILVKLIKGKKTNSELVLFFFSLAFSFKLQAILFLPVILFYMLIQKNKDVRISQFIYVPIVYILTALPMLIYGRSLSDVLMEYVDQTEQYNSFLNMRYCNFYNFIGYNTVDAKDGYFALGLILAAAIVGLVFYLFFKSNVEFAPDTLLLLGSFTVFTMAFFLPAMHERYAFVGEMLIVVLALVNVKYIVPAIGALTCTLFTYGDYLSGESFEISTIGGVLIAIVRLAVIVYLMHGIISLKGKENSIVE